jgi:membrane-associated HD superfamily phosphohydrolase
MLSDSVEAALKSLGKPLGGKADLEKLVGGVVDSKIMGGQFINVDFTLREIHAIKTAFVEVMMSMYHSREIKPIVNSEDEPRGEPPERGTSDAPAA